MNELLGVVETLNPFAANCFQAVHWPKRNARPRTKVIASHGVLIGSRMETSVPVEFVSIIARALICRRANSMLTLLTSSTNVLSSNNLGSATGIQSLIRLLVRGSSDGKPCRTT